MVDSPDKIREDIEKHDYREQNWEISGQIRHAIKCGINFTTVPYEICETLKKELKEKKYNVTERPNWLWGKTTIISW